MKLTMWQVDAFSAAPLGGNPAAIVPLDSWLAADLMQAIAAENNVAETAFFVKAGAGKYDLRWFAPSREVDLCGHATLASAWIIFNKIDTALNEVRFTTRSGELIVTRSQSGNVMSLPSAESASFTPPPGFGEMLGASLKSPPPKELHISTKGGAGAQALIAVWDTPDQVKALNPSTDLCDVLMQIQCGSLLATAPGDGVPYDMVSRFFAPYYGVSEDPVTGSAHAALTPFWSRRLGKKQLKARQASARGGDLTCTYAGERTIIQGDCALYLTGEIEV
ncbi:MAG TPA: PhzF family phenazine biosynthesis protein [Rhizomicrobium sp.]|jgi:PhzF family phenazine biosynthesis protein